MGMNVSGAQVTQAALQNLESLEPARMRLQAMLLKKTLDAQQEQSNELMKLMDGKGQIIDMRV